MMLVIVTDGLPSSVNARPTKRDQTEFVGELRRFANQFNCFLVIRLATDQDEVVEFYNQARAYVRECSWSQFNGRERPQTATANITDQYLTA